MNIRFVRKIIGIILTALLLTAIVLLAGTTAGAQVRNQRRVVIVRPIHPIHHFGRYDPFRDPYGRFHRYNYYRQYVFSNSEKAYNRGYKDGLKTGEKDGRKSKSFDPERSHYYHDAGFGNYAEAYRSGFSTGYQVGFRAHGVG